MDLKKLIIFQKHKGIFTLFCALSFTKASYFSDISDKKISNITKEVSSFLRKRKMESTSGLKRFFKKQHPYYFVNWVLQHSDPPQFKRLYKKWEGELPLKWHKHFGKLLRKFYFEADIPQLWKRYQETYSKEIKRCRKTPFLVIRETLSYLRIKKLPFKKIVFIPNFLDAIRAGYAHTIRGKAYITFGPSKNKLNTRLLRHEFLHCIINSLVEKCGCYSSIIKSNKRFLQKTTSGIARKYYDDPNAITSEYILRAIEGRLLSFDKRKYYFKEQKKAGFPYIEFFNLQLENYEKNKKSFSKYLPVILRNIAQLK